MCQEHLDIPSHIAIRSPMTVDRRCAIRTTVQLPETECTNSSKAFWTFPSFSASLEAQAKVLCPRCTSLPIHWLKNCHQGSRAEVAWLGEHGAVEKPVFFGGESSTHQSLLKNTCRFRKKNKWYQVSFAKKKINPRSVDQNCWIFPLPEWPWRIPSRNRLIQ